VEIYVSIASCWVNANWNEARGSGPINLPMMRIEDLNGPNMYVTEQAENNEKAQNYNKSNLMQLFIFRAL